jgi:hypothetical protein
MGFDKVVHKILLSGPEKLARIISSRCLRIYRSVSVKVEGGFGLTLGILLRGFPIILHSIQNLSGSSPSTGQTFWLLVCIFFGR